jgi:hypothetical protein
MGNKGLSSNPESIFLSRASVCYYTFSLILLLTFSCRYSILPALSLSNGVIYCNIIEGAFDTASFMKFIQGLLTRMQPFSLPNFVIVMDNCRIHKNPEILDMVEAA